ncbi:tubulin polyglutamylase complex subunit 1 isoform X1 [Hippopotamus amphibius kiboko]|uniref:tubulin polyglutamylase complex subunit 1 isoform X1 n=1 Tax=Hippopotamus amphibius kiboko TaxID=575201 RepID=UPI00259683BA|nr:tubulin polyglutamylase complex subunit 1 isoform X1 [Hippopotamus amphibius kiboko]
MAAVEKRRPAAAQAAHFPDGGRPGVSRAAATAESEEDFLRQVGATEMLRAALLKLLEARPEEPIAFLAHYFENVGLRSPASGGAGEPPGQLLLQQQRLGRALWHLRLAHHSQRLAPTTAPASWGKELVTEAPTRGYCEAAANTVPVLETGAGEDRLQQQRGCGLRVPERQRAQEEAGAGRAHVQRAAEAHLPGRGGPRGGGGAAAAQDPVPGPRGRAAGRVPRGDAHLLRAAGVRGARRRPLPAAGGPGLGRGRPPRGPGRAGHAGGGPAGQRRHRARELPGGRLAPGARQPGAGHGPRAGGPAAQRPHDPGGVPGEGCRPLHRQGQARGLSPSLGLAAASRARMPGALRAWLTGARTGVSLHAGAAGSPPPPASHLE